MSVLSEHAAELSRCGVVVGLEVTLADVVTPTRCRGCRKRPADLLVTAELVAADPVNQPTRTLGRVEVPLCRPCVEHIAPGLVAALGDAAAEGEASCYALTAIAAPLLQWLGCPGRLVGTAGVRVVPTTDEPDAAQTGGVR